MMSICHSNIALMGENRNYFGFSVVFIVQMIMICCIYYNKRKLCPNFVDSNHVFIKYDLRYVYIASLIGFIIASNYEEYRQLVIGFISLNLPILTWLFYRPDVSIRILSFWYKFAWIPFVLFFYTELGFTQFYMQPILILLCLFPLYKKWYVFIIILLGIMFAFVDVEEQRAPLIKAGVAFTTGTAILFRKVLPYKLVKFGHVCCYLSSLVLFVWIFSGLFNVVSGQEEARYVAEHNNDSERQNRDTRSLLYIDAIESSINHNYYLFGHTPARGFEVKYSGILFMDSNTVLNKNERHKSEMVLANIYTWCGLIGLILYSLIYMRASYLAVYRSRNKVLPLLGCFVAWRWSWGWVEDVNNFLCTDIDLWAMIAICYSEYFRGMSDNKFALWARGLLSKPCRKRFLKSFKA